MEKSFDLNIPRIGYFLVYRTLDKPYHKLIEDQQLKDGYSKDKAKFVHVELSLGGPHTVTAAMPKIKIANIYDNYGRYVKIVKPKIADYDEKRKNVAIECLRRVNMPYGFLGVLWFKLRKFMKRNYLAAFGDFCTELCGMGVHNYYVVYRGFAIKDAMPKYYAELYPADFLNEQYFETVWEGYII